MATDLEHYYKYGDVYGALGACEELQATLARLRREGLLSTTEWREADENVAEVFTRIQRHIDNPALTPKGPRLP